MDNSDRLVNWKNTILAERNMTVAKSSMNFELHFKLQTPDWSHLEDLIEFYKMRLSWGL